MANADTLFSTNQKGGVAAGLNNNFRNRSKAGDRQDISSNVNVQNQIIQRGFNYITYAGGTPNSSKSITFPQVFDSSDYDLFISNIGYKDGGDPTSRTDLTDQDSIAYFSSDTHTTAGFRVTGKTIDGSSPASSRRVLFSWVAIGTKA